MRTFLILIQAGLLTLLAVIGAHSDGENRATCPASSAAGYEYCAL